MGELITLLLILAGVAAAIFVLPYILYYMDVYMEWAFKRAEALTRRRKEEKRYES